MDDRAENWGIRGEVVGDAQEAAEEKETETDDEKDPGFPEARRFLSPHRTQGEEDHPGQQGPEDVCGDIEHRRFLIAHP